jgi:putative oxidoreductase
MLSVTTTSADALDTVLLVLRVVVGLTMAAHGYQKIFLGGKIPGTAGWFESLGMRAGTGRFHAVTAATTEIGSGLLIAVGLLTPLAGAAFVGVMAVAGWVHRDHGFFVFKEGVEYNLVLATIGVTLATLGPGRFSLDHAIGVSPDWYGWRGFATALVLGLGLAAALLAVFYRTPQR